MGYFGIETYLRGPTSIDLRVGLNPDDTGTYKTVVSRSGSSSSQELSYGSVSAGTSHDVYPSFSGLTGNTSYTFSAQLYAKDRWDGDDDWFAGVTTSASIMTYPNPATNVNATLNSDQTTVTIGWYQSIGGGASSTISCYARIEKTGGQSVARSTTVSTTSSASKSVSVDVSGLENGTYRAYIMSENLATDADGGIGVFSPTPAEFTINRQAQTVSGSITTSSATPSGTEATVSFSFNNDSSSAYNMYYVIGVGTNSSSSASSYTYTYQSSSLTKNTGTSSYSQIMPNSGDALNPATTYYYRIDVYGKGANDNSYTLLDSDTGSFQTAAASATGSWSSGPSATVSGSTINYSATWRQSSAGSTSWTFGVYLDDANASGRQYNQTATLSQNGTHNISGSIQNASEGEHTIYFNATADGVNAWESEDVTIGASGPPTGSWTTSPSVAQTAGAMAAAYNAVVTRNDSVSQSYYVRIRITNASGSATIATSSVTSINKTGSVTINGITDTLTAGTYTYSFIPEYSTSTSGPWTELGNTSGSSLATSVSFLITQSTASSVPTGSWTVAPSVSQDENATTATCSATIKRNDSLSKSFYVRIRVTDPSGNDISAGSGTSIASNGTVTVSCATGTLTVGSHSYTFTPEWRETTSQGWATLQSSTGSSIVRTAAVIISEDGTPDTPEPLGQTLYRWSWSNNTLFNKMSHDSSAEERQLAFTALTSSVPSERSTTNFSHNVWNDLVHWLTYSLGHLEISYSESIASGAKIDSEPYTLTAAKWNSMVILYNKLLTDGVNGSASDKLSSVKSGDTVYGSMFTNLVTVMNQYIDTYNNQ